MKISSYFIFLLLIAMSSTGCEKENLGGIDAFLVYFPNIILPNNQENNLFYPKILSNNPDAEFTAEIMEIFDRYGNPVYKSEQFPTNDPTYGWDGTVEGDLVESGNYSYSIRITDGTGTALYVGDFSVIR